MSGQVTATILETLNLTSEGCSAEIAACTERNVEPYLHLTIDDLTYQLSASDARNLATALSNAATGLQGYLTVEEIERNFVGTRAERLRNLGPEVDQWNSRTV